MPYFSCWRCILACQINYVEGFFVLQFACFVRPVLYLSFEACVFCWANAGQTLLQVRVFTFCGQFCCVCEILGVKECFITVLSQRQLLSQMVQRDICLQVCIRSEFIQCCTEMLHYYCSLVRASSSCDCDMQQTFHSSCTKFQIENAASVGGSVSYFCIIDRVSSLNNFLYDLWQRFRVPWY